MASDIVDKLFTRNRLHLIFGPPRSGVSTLLIQTMWEWSHGRDIFSAKSNPSHYCYVDAIRPFEEIKAHFTDLGYPAAEIPHISVMEAMSHEERTIDAVLRKSKELIHGCPVIFLDGLQSLFHGNVIQYRDVLNFTIDIAKVCTRDKITIFATLGTSKSLEGTGTPILQRVMGSTAWLRVAGTLVHIGAPQGQDLKAERTITLFPPRRKPIELAYTFNDEGHLEYTGDATTCPELDAWLLQITPGSELTTQDILDAAAARNVGKRIAQYWTAQQVKLGTLENPKRGIYVKPFPPDSGGPTTKTNTLIQ